MSLPDLSVIVPTTGRRPELFRALDSILSQPVRALPIVVLNGGRAEPDIRSALAARRDIRLIVREEPGLNGARLAGRKAVDTPLLNFLDDDDTLLPGALARQVDALTPEYDAVVMNGVRDFGGRREKMYPDFPATGEDIERATLNGAWLCPGAMLVHSDSAPAAFFADLPVHCQSTLMSLRAARTMRLRFIDEPAVVHYEGTAEQATLSERYLNVMPVALRQGQVEAARAEIREGLRRKEANSWHVLAEFYLKRGQAAKAWDAHWRSLKSGGWRFLPYTRRLIAA